MKLSELIIKAQKTVSEKGDIDVYCDGTEGGECPECGGEKEITHAGFASSLTVASVNGQCVLWIRYRHE